MKTQELKDNVGVVYWGCGNYKVTTVYNGKRLECLSHDSLSYDRIKETRQDGVSEHTKSLGITYRQALLALHNECLKKNNIVKKITFGK